MTKLVSNITIVMNDQRPAPTPCTITVTNSALLERARFRLARAVEWRDSMIGSPFSHLKQAHDEVTLLRSVIADLGSGA